MTKLILFIAIVIAIFILLSLKAVRGWRVRRWQRIQDETKRIANDLVDYGVGSCDSRIRTE